MHNPQKRLMLKTRNRLLSKKKLHLTDLQVGICIGTLLGDSSMFLKQNGARGLQMSHCEKQKDYLEWKKDLLKPFFVASAPSQYQGSVQKVYCRRSVVHQDFTDIYGLMYRMGKKYVTRRVLNKLNDLGLLLWFLDDGTMAKDRDARLATDGFSEGENMAIKKWFEQKYRINAIISYNSLKKTYFLRFNVGDTNKLLHIFEKFYNIIPQCMLYKISQRPYVRYSYNNKNKDMV